MKQVVKAVEAALEKRPQANPVTVRLKIRTGSHLMEHDSATIQTAFELVARGTRLEGATVELLPFTGEAWCPGCRWDGTCETPTSLCPNCGGVMLRDEEAPEVVVQEVVVEE
ncbi:MAG: hydrogenase maturation nickel metallochaperone HypA [Nitrospira sp.]|nr:hydrogenase maturation nickel metallochaperone HypA [Nitrospira sp.]